MITAAQWVRILQLCGVAADGVIGKITLQALNAAPPAKMAANFNGARLAFMADLPTWPSFGRGWSRRIASNLLAI